MIPLTNHHLWGSAVMIYLENMGWFALVFYSLAWSPSALADVYRDRVSKNNMAMGQNLWYHLWVDEHPFTSYFDVNYRGTGFWPITIYEWNSISGSVCLNTREIVSNTSGSNTHQTHVIIENCIWDSIILEYLAKPLIHEANQLDIKRNMNDNAS